MPTRTTPITLPESVTGQVRTLTGYGPAPLTVSKTAMPLRAAARACGLEWGDDRFVGPAPGPRLRVEPFEVRGHGDEAEKMAENLVHVSREAAAALGYAPLGERLCDAAEGRIRLFVERIAHEKVRGNAEDQEREGEKPGEPQGEAGPERADKHYSTFIT